MSLSSSRPNNLPIKPIGVINKKNIIPNTNGLTTLPKNSSNKYQALLSGVRTSEILKAAVRKNKATENIKSTTTDKPVFKSPIAETAKKVTANKRSNFRLLGSLFFSSINDLMSRITLSFRKN